MSEDESIPVKRRLLILIASIVLIAFITNLIWEFSQALIFFEGQHWLECFWATVGDVVTILGIYAVLAVVKRNAYWIEKMRASDVIIVCLLGAIWAVGIEIWALSTNRWQYNFRMPVIPVLKVGAIPVLQMTVLPVISFLLGSSISRKFQNA